jgi:hypothetical protein
MSVAAYDAVVLWVAWPSSLSPSPFFDEQANCFRSLHAVLFGPSFHPREQFLWRRTADTGPISGRPGFRVRLCLPFAMRVSELVEQCWSAIDWKRADIAVNRLKNGKDTRQPLDGADLRALRALHRER